jgi:hypothetical protein
MALAVLALVNGLVAEGQSETYTDHETAVAQLAVHEGGWRLSDAAAIAYARGHLDLPTLRRMHRRALGGRPREAWIGALRADGEQPTGWPAHLDWSAYRGRWLDILATVRGVTRGTVAPPCSERPQVWGGREVDADRIRVILAGGGRDVCRGTRNAFLVLGRGRR